MRLLNVGKTILIEDGFVATTIERYKMYTLISNRIFCFNLLSHSNFSCQNESPKLDAAFA